MVLHFEQETTGYVLNTCAQTKVLFGDIVDDWEVMLLWPDSHPINFLAHCHVNALTMCFLS